MRRTPSDPAHPSRHDGVRPAVLAESLEPRRLLTAELTDRGILEVIGTNNADVIRFEDTSPADPEADRTFRVLQSEVDDEGVESEVEVFGPFRSADVQIAQVLLGDGDDLLVVGRRALVAVEAFAGDGNDSISGGRLADTLSGGPGDDYLFGGAGDDQLTGNAGADALIGGLGDGDTVDYRQNGADEPITVVLDDEASDGAAGEGDLVGVDVERVVGGAGDDFIAATGRGPITFDGRLRPPVAFFGGPGDDQLIGDDQSQAAIDAAAVAAGFLPPAATGRGDTLVGDAGSDTLDGQGGDDLLLAEDAEVDSLVGGAGADVASADEDDDVAGAEILVRPGESNPGQEEGQLARLVDGVVVVVGSDGDDRILVRTVNTGTDADGLPVDVVEVDVNLAAGGSSLQRFDFADVAGVRVAALAGDDLVAVTGVPRASANTSIAPATVSGGLGDDTLLGGDGDDLLDAGPGDNYLLGSFGDDTLSAGFGSDYLAGGPGDFDRVSYAGRGPAEPLRVGLGRLFDDGFVAGENDNVRIDVEDLVGGSGDDLFTTIDDSPVRFYGQAGDDTLGGSDAADFLVGGTGFDELFGLGGNDFFAALDGLQDQIFGGPGVDDGDFDERDLIDLGPQF